jgi:hypothetical protein
MEGITESESYDTIDSITTEPDNEHYLHGDSEYPFEEYDLLEE